MPPAAAGKAAGAASAPKRQTAYTGTRTRARGGESDSGPERPSDKRRRRSEARDRDQPLADAYEAGRAGGPRPEDPELAGYYDDGAKMVKRERRLERTDRVKAGAAEAAQPAIKKAGSAANDGAGFFLGLFVYALGINFLRGGPAGAKAWMAAKFLNRTGADAATPTASSTPARPSAPNAPLLGSIGPKARSR